MRRARTLAMALGAALWLLAASASAQDRVAAAGERLFARCAACHAFDPAARRAGPHLDGIVGRPAGEVAGFRYSAAMRSAREGGLVWDEAALDAFLASPRDFLSGTSMRMALSNAAERAAMIDYLRARAAAGDGSG